MNKILATAIVSLLLFSCSGEDPRDYYQLKIYHLANTDQESRMDNYLENAFIPACKRSGIESVGVFKSEPADSAGKKDIFVLIPFSAPCSFAWFEEELGTDLPYLEQAVDYLSLDHADPPFDRMESILLRSFASYPGHHIPEFDTPPENRVYELRSYQGATESLYRRKVEMFDEAGETALFVKLGFQPVFFGEVISGPDMPNLMYMTSFSDAESQVKHWDSFRESDEWSEMKTIEKYRNTVSHIDKFMLKPAAYSDI
jgi:hypothetical protein